MPQEGPKGHQMDQKIVKNREVLSEGALRRNLKKEQKNIDFLTLQNLKN